MSTLNNKLEATASTIASTRFRLFVPFAFRRAHDRALGEQPYITHMCHRIEGLIDHRENRLLINLPPQHLKSFVGTICLSAYLLGKNPKLRVLLVAYNDDFAESLCGRIRDMMRSDWYRKMFTTRIRDDHSRADDFRTTEGGGIFAVAATGAVTGRSADFIIYDDPHEIGDWNNERKLALVRNNFNTILSRLPDKDAGRVLVIAHRVSEDDLSADLLQEGWNNLRLPLVAPRRRHYQLGDGEEWVREKGDVLQPKAYPDKEIKRLRRTQVMPPFSLFHQQGLDERGTFKPNASHFQAHEKHERPIAPVVLSIDPGHGGRAEASRSVIQAWKHDKGQYYLIDQFCDHCDFAQLEKKFWLFKKRHNASVVLIEKTAYGPALYSRVRERAKLDIKLILPHASKAERLAGHYSKIRRKTISLPADAIWRQSFIDEIIEFPGEYDDQVDAMTQYLDYMDTKPVIPSPTPHGFIAGIALGSEHYRWLR